MCSSTGPATRRSDSDTRTSTGTSGGTRRRSRAWSPTCKGQRLKPESLAVTVADRNIAQVCELSVSGAIGFFEGLALTEREQLIARGILKEILERLQFMIDVGLEYLT